MLKSYKAAYLKLSLEIEELVVSDALCAGSKLVERKFNIASLVWTYHG